MKTSHIKHRVIIVEDNLTSRTIMTKIIEQAGHKVIECVGGRQAVEIAAINPPPVMIVDVMLPDMRGTQVVEELCEAPAFRFTKFLFVTGILSNKTSPSQPVSYFNIKGKRYPALSKPIDKELLLSLLDTAIAASKAERKAVHGGPVEASLPEIEEPNAADSESSGASAPARHG